MTNKTKGLTMWSSSTSAKSIFIDDVHAKNLSIDMLKSIVNNDAKSTPQLDTAPYKTSFNESSLGYIVS